MGAAVVGSKSVTVATATCSGAMPTNWVHSDTGIPSRPTNVAAQAPPGIDDAARRADFPGPANGVESDDHRSPCISDVPTGPSPVAGPGAGAVEPCVGGAATAGPPTIAPTSIATTMVDAASMRMRAAHIRGPGDVTASL